jgi:hypothetical protein
MLESTTGSPRTSQTFDTTASDDGQLVVVEHTPDGDVPHYVNSVDATAGQPIVTRVLTRKLELEAALSALPETDLRGRSDLDIALTSIGELLTGDLEHVPHVVVASMNRWLERTKHLAETAAVVVAIDDPVTSPMASLR